MSGGTLIALVLLAVGLDLLLMLGLKKFFQKRGVYRQAGEQGVFIFGRYSPLMTWFKTLRRTRLLVASTPFNARFDPGILDLAGTSEGAAARPRLWLPAPIFLSLTLILAAAPVFLVFRDRWLQNPWTPALLGERSCQQFFWCAGQYPSYFLLIFPLLLVLLLVVLFLRETPPIALVSHPSDAAAEALPLPGIGQAKLGRALLWAGWLGFAAILFRSLLRQWLPGWELALVIAALAAGFFLSEVGLQAVPSAWRRRPWLLPFLLAHLALILFLDNLYSTLHFDWIYALLLLAAGLNLARHIRRVPVILWIFTLALVLYTLNINAWWTSAIGDEYEFYIWAKAIAHQQSLAHIAAHLFSKDGAYGSHPYLSSVIQAISVRLLGANSFGWRFSSIYLSAASLLFFYAFLKSFLAPRISLAAALLLAFSPYLMSFSKIGYNNLQAYFALSLALWAALQALRWKSRGSYALLGWVLGFCFYLYPAALYALPIPLLLLLVYEPPLTLRALSRWALMAAMMFILVYPLFLQPEFWQTKIPGTFLFNDTLATSLPALLAHFRINLQYAFFSFLFSPEEGHFIAVSYVDPLTAVFVALGLASLLRSALRQRFAVFWFLSFAAMLFLAGASHDRQFPPSTRMFLILPWFAVFAALGLFWLLAQVRRVAGAKLRSALAALLLLCALGLSLYQAYPLARDRMTGFQSLETLFLRTLQRAQRVYPNEPMTYVFITDPTWSSTPIHKLPEYYPLQANFAEVVITGDALPSSASELLAAAHTFFILNPWLDETRTAALEDQLRQNNRLPCAINTTNGYARFQLWHPPGLEQLCE